MSALNGTNLPLVGVGTSLLQGSQVAETEDQAAVAEAQGASVGIGQTVGNTSGLLQNFVLPKTTLDALGLLKPSNQGDSEALVSQAFLIAERLADESESAQATAFGEFAAGQAAAIEAFLQRISTLEAENAAAQGQINTNNGKVNKIDRNIGNVAEQISELEGQKQSLNAEIDALVQIAPQTDDIRAQIDALSAQITGIDDEIQQLNGTLADLQAEKTGLLAQNENLQTEIGNRQSTIDDQQQLALLISEVFSKTIVALEGTNQSVDETQDLTSLESGEVILEETLPNMQQIFDFDIEDVAIENLIANSAVTEEEAAKAVAISYGLAGSFYESLGIFFQLANLGELDLDSTAFGNNKSQRVEIFV